MNIIKKFIIDETKDQIRELNKNHLVNWEEKWNVEKNYN